MTRSSSLLIVVPLLGACLWTTPEQAAEDALPYDGREGPTHMPGYPCLACHSEEHSPGDEVFVLAGTVYERAGDAWGLQGAEVRVTDEAGHELSVVTNEAGNFMVRDGDGDREDDERGRGETRIGFKLDWPLRVEVRHGERVRHMRSRIHREGSCATCHVLGAPSATSAGPIFLVEDPP